MTYWEETIPADANPGPLVGAAIGTKLIALGWTLDDTRVIGTRTHKVYKSAAAGNTYSLDWWLDVSYPTTGIATGVMLTPFEGYDPATGLALRGPFSSTGTIIDATTYSRLGATASALETNWVNTGSHTALDTPLSIGGFGIFASVTRDRAILMATTEPTQASYAGFFIPTAEHASHAGSALFPLITVRLAGSTDRVSSTATASVAAALTRVPKMTTMGSWGSHCVVGPNTMRMNGKVGGAAAEADGQISSAPFLVGSAGASPSWTNGTSTHIGELDGVKCAFADAAVVRGDVATVDGVAHATSTYSAPAVILIEKV